MQLNEVSEGRKNFFFFFPENVQGAVEERVGGLSTVFYIWHSSKSISAYQSIMSQSTSKIPLTEFSVMSVKMCIMQKRRK